MTKNIKTFIIAGLVCCSTAVTMTSCNDYLDIYPENVQPTDEYWSSKEDVEATLMAGYYYLRASVEDNLIPWGELRAGCISSRSSNALQRFEVKPTSSITKWASMYKIVNAANLVLKNASEALANDDTYNENAMRSHYCEAYWLRALAYFYLVRNWRDVPLITQPFETDELTINVAKSSEEKVIAQIKSDLETAIKLNASKEKFNTTWETKGRATKWAIYALLADVCLWNQDFDEAITYADAILNSSSASAPHFMSTPSHTSWFTIFNPGNSNESIYEVQWSYDKLSQGTPQTNTLVEIFNPSGSYKYLYSTQMLDDFRDEYRTLREKYAATFEPDLGVRTMYGGFVTNESNAENFENATSAYCYKYYGGTSYNILRGSVQEFDGNYILYRVADIMLMKAEALIMRNLGKVSADNQEAIDIIDQIRARTNLDATTDVTNTSSLSDLLQKGVLHERIMELAGEGKAWYDFLRIGRYTDPSGETNFKKILIDNVVTYNKAVQESRIRSVLNDENAWFMPINASEINANKLLEQNPYYL